MYVYCLRQVILKLFLTLLLLTLSLSSALSSPTSHDSTQGSRLHWFHSSALPASSLDCTNSVLSQRLACVSFAPPWCYIPLFPTYLSHCMRKRRRAIWKYNLWGSRWTVCVHRRHCGTGQGNACFDYFLVTGTYWEVINNNNPLLSYLYNTIP